MPSRQVRRDMPMCPIAPIQFPAPSVQMLSSRPPQKNAPEIPTQPDPIPAANPNPNPNPRRREADLANPAAPQPNHAVLPYRLPPSHVREGGGGKKKVPSVPFVPIQ